MKALKRPHQNFNLLTIFRRGTITNRLLVVMLIFTLIPCVLIYFSAIYFIKHIVYENYMENYLIGIYDSVQAHINRYIYQINMFSTTVSTDNSIYSIWNNAEIENEEKKRLLRGILSDYLSENEIISDIQLRTQPGDVIQVSENTYSDIDKNFDKEIRPTGIAVYDSVVLDGSGEKYIVFGKKFYSFQSGYHLGTMYLFVKESLVASAYESAVTNGNSFFIITSGGVVISHYNKMMLNKTLLVPDDLYGTNISHAANTSGYIYNMHQIELDATGKKYWEIVSLLNCRNLFSTVDMLQYGVRLIIINVTILSVLLSFLLSHSLIRSMSQLQYKMNKFVTGNAEDVKFEFHEIAALENSFDKMVMEIKALIEKNNEEKEKQKVAELKALQAQINPHFIYNALDAIIWHAKIEKQEYLADMVYELASFFKISLHNGENIIYVWEEIKHVESYVKIEQMRFPNLFEIHYKLQEDILNCMMPKIILQPIIENAIKHGFDDRESGGIITVTGYLDENDDVVFEIEDNGKGMNFDPLTTESSSSGYGVKNVNERLVLEYGDEYRLRYRSKVGEGTWVGIKIKNRSKKA